MNKDSFNIEYWMHESFRTFTENYFNSFILLVVLFVLGWNKWLIWTFYENRTAIILLYLVVYYLYGCIFKRCITFFKKNTHTKQSQYINLKSCILYFLSELILSIIFIVGLIFFIVPGFILALKFSMTRLIVIDQEKNPFIALKESYKLTTGNTLLLSVIILPIFCMWAIGRFAVYSLSGIPSGDLNILLILLSSLLGLISCFFILPLTFIALSKAYTTLSSE